jgi:DNA-directed RNA polymerase specialized sigma24 family protein
MGMNGKPKGKSWPTTLPPPSSPLSEHEKAARYATFCDRYRKPSETYVGKLLKAHVHSLGSRIDAADVVQRVLVKFLEMDSLSRYEPIPDIPFHAWLSTVLSNQLLDEVRKLGREVVISSEAWQKVADEAKRSYIEDLARRDALARVREIALEVRKQFLERQRDSSQQHCAGCDEALSLRWAQLLRAERDPIGSCPMCHRSENACSNRASRIKRELNESWVRRIVHIFPESKFQELLSLLKKAETDPEPKGSAT